MVTLFDPIDVSIIDAEAALNKLVNDGYVLGRSLQVENVSKMAKPEEMIIAFRKCAEIIQNRVSVLNAQNWTGPILDNVPDKEWLVAVQKMDEQQKTQELIKMAMIKNFVQERLDQLEGKGTYSSDESGLLSPTNTYFEILAKAMRYADAPNYYHDMAGNGWNAELCNDAVYEVLMPRMPDRMRIFIAARREAALTPDV